MPRSRSSSEARGSGQRRGGSKVDWRQHRTGQDWADKGQGRWSACDDARRIPGGESGGVTRTCALRVFEACGAVPDTCRRELGWGLGHQHVR